jgi:hypothetical protein
LSRELAYRVALVIWAEVGIGRAIAVALAHGSSTFRRWRLRPGAVPVPLLTLPPRRTDRPNSSTRELAPRAITINALAPGFITDTPFHETFTPSDAQAKMLAGIP